MTPAQWRTRTLGPAHRGKQTQRRPTRFINQIARTHRHIGRAWTLKEQLRHIYRLNHLPGVATRRGADPSCCWFASASRWLAARADANNPALGGRIPPAPAMIERTIAWLTRQPQAALPRRQYNTGRPRHRSTDANQQKPKPSHTTLTTGSGCTLITRNEVCMKPGMLQY